MTQRPRWTFLLALGVLSVIALAGVGAASGAKVVNVKSTVTIKSGEGAEFTGKVNAAQKKCKAKRKVKLFMEPYSGEDDELVGTAKTNASGEWSIQGSFIAGIYHAQVISSFVHTGSGDFHCLGYIGMSARF